MKRYLVLSLALFLCFTWVTDSSARIRLSGEGMIGMSRSGERVLWTLPESLLERSMSLFLTVLETDFKPSSDLKFGYEHDRFGPVVVRFRREGESVAFEMALGQEEAFPGTSGWGVVRWLPVCAGPSASDTVTLDVTDLLQDDRMFGISSFAFHMRLGSFAYMEVEEVQVVGEQVYVRSVSGYDAAFFPGLDPVPTRWTVGACLSLLPEVPMPVRFRDRRVGYFTIPAARDGFRDRIIKRWRPGVIRFCIHPDFPESLVPAVERALNNWEVVFRKHNLPISLVLADGKERRDDDSRVSWITFKDSPKEDAYGRPYVDVRTGEILNSRITVFSGVFELYRRWYVSQTGDVGRIPDDVVEALFEMTMTHEIGHVLGLEHNYYASSVTPYDCLDDDGYLRQYGFTSSVMDYVRINYAYDGTLPVTELVARIGQYDEAAVVWGYGCHDDSAAEAFAREMFQNPMTRYLHQDGADPQTSSEDVGDSPVECAHDGMLKLRKACRSYSECDEPDLPYADFSKAVSVQYSHLLEHVLMCVGGVWRRVGTDGTVIYEPVSSSYQDAAVEFITAHALSCPQWLPSDIWEKAVEGIPQRLEARLEQNRNKSARQASDRRQKIEPLVPPADNASVDAKGYFPYNPDLTSIEMMAPSVFVRCR